MAESVIVVIVAVVVELIKLPKQRRSLQKKIAYITHWASNEPLVAKFKLSKVDKLRYKLISIPVGFCLKFSPLKAGER